MSMKDILQQADGPTRRGFVTGAAGAFLGLAGMPLFERMALAQDQDKIPLLPATARNVIYIFLSGGMTQLDTFDLKPGTANQGDTEPLKTSADDVRVSSRLPILARQMHNVAVINSMTSTQGAHAQGRYFMHTSYEMRGTIKHPSMGAWLTRMAGRANPTLPGHVTIGGAQYASAGFFDPSHIPLPIGDPLKGLADSKRARGVTEKTFDHRMDRLAKMNEAFAKRNSGKGVDAYTDMYDQAVRLMTSSDLAAFDIAKEPQALRDAYGNDQFGQGCLLARRLVENGVRFVEVTSGGWDSHNEVSDAMDNKLPVLDRGVGTLLADLEVRGLLDETLVVLATEFGRTPEINSRKGRDHFPKAFSCLLAGGGIKGGLNWGKTNETGEEVIADKVSVPDFNATIAYALGLPLEHKLFSPSGRPFTPAHKGKPVLGLFA